MNWEYGNRSGYKSIEMYGADPCGTAPPIELYNLDKSRALLARVQQFFFENPGVHIFTLDSQSDLGEPFFLSSGELIKPALSVMAYGTKDFQGYIAKLTSLTFTSDLRPAN